MMNNARLQRWKPGAYCALGCLLAAFSQLTFASPDDLDVRYNQARARIDAMEATLTRTTSGGKQVRIESNVRHTNLPGGVTRHVKTGTWIPARRVGRAASFLMKRGTQIGWAISALELAGYIYDQSNGSLSKQNENADIPDFDSINSVAINGNNSFSSGRATLYAAAADNCSRRSRNNQYIGGPGRVSVNAVYSDYVEYRVLCNFNHWNSDSQFVSGGYVAGKTVQNPPSDDFDYPSSTSPASFDDAEVLDIVSENVTASSTNDIINSSSNIDEWSEQNSSSPFSNNVSAGSGVRNVPPEVFEKVGKENQNLANRYDGNEPESDPYPDTDTSPGTDPSSEVLEELTRNPTGDDGQFPDQSPEWQTEIISELPDYDTGLGAGSCPAPAVIPLPLGWGNFELNWQPICDFASYIRGAVIAVGFLIALYIVLGVRASS